MWKEPPLVCTGETEEKLDTTVRIVDTLDSNWVLLSSLTCDVLQTLPVLLGP